MAFRDDRRYDFWDTGWNEVPAVYGIMTGSGVMIYIGQTDNLQRRMDEHRRDRTHCMHRYAPKRVVVEVIHDERARLLRERQLINEYRPPCNKV